MVEILFVSEFIFLLVIKELKNRAKSFLRNEYINDEKNGDFLTLIRNINPMLAINFMKMRLRYDGPTLNRKMKNALFRKLLRFIGIVKTFYEDESEYLDNIKGNVISIFNNTYSFKKKKILTKLYWI